MSAIVRRKVLDTAARRDTAHSRVGVERYYRASYEDLAPLYLCGRFC